MGAFPGRRAPYLAVECCEIAPQESDRGATAQALQWVRPMELCENECWRAVANRDARYDGRFVYGVKTTGIFCRPSCPSRRAKRENVRFYPSVDRAREDGLRACRRCRPGGDRSRQTDEASQRSASSAAQMSELARFIAEHADEPLSLARLAERAGMSQFHLQRTFRSVIGATPKEFQTALRFQRLKSSLRCTDSVLDAVFRAGFGSTSRVYERLDDRLGMTPSAYRAGGHGERIVYAGRKTAIGWLLMAATDRGVCFVHFGDSRDALVAALEDEFPAAELAPSPAQDHPEFERWMQALEDYLAQRAPSPEVPLDLRGTAFQIRVWRFLLTVRDGEVVSYGEVARAIGAPRAARAVANACAANHIAALIPCHRVLRGDGSLGGYRWGEERKQALLDREQKPSPDC